MSTKTQKLSLYLHNLEVKENLQKGWMIQAKLSEKMRVIEREIVFIIQR